MTTRKFPPNLVTTPTTGVVSEAPKAIEIPEHLQNQFFSIVAGRFGRGSSASLPWAAAITPLATFSQL